LLTEGPVVELLTEGPVVELLTEGPVVELLTEGPVVKLLTEGPVVELLTEGPVVELLTEPELVALMVSVFTLEEEAAVPVWTVDVVDALTTAAAVGFWEGDTWLVARENIPLADLGALAGVPKGPVRLFMNKGRAFGTAAAILLNRSLKVTSTVFRAPQS
jgi:hypothetical protein